MNFFSNRRIITTMNKTLICAMFLTLSVVLFECRDANTEEQKQPETVAELGQLLFFDSILSKGNQVSCASCHKEEFAFSDNTPVSFGVDSLKGGRNTPSCMNMSSRSFFFWDGRAETLEEQAAGPIENPVEMNLPLTEAVKRLKGSDFYRMAFMKVFQSAPTKENLCIAIAEYERTLETSDTPFDFYLQKRGDTTLFTASAKRGRIIFNEKGKCFDCHFGPDFTPDQFRNIGLFNGQELNDSGRFDKTRNLTDLGKFKTPGLRNIALTAPYMHNGMHKTLREVIDYYDNPDKFVKNSQNRDTLLQKPLNLTENEKKDLENFLLSLTDIRFSTAKSPVVKK